MILLATLKGKTVEGATEDSMAFWEHALHGSFISWAIQTNEPKKKTPKGKRAQQRSNHLGNVEKGLGPPGHGVIPGTPTRNKNKSG